MNVFPAAFPLSGRRVVIVGDGEAADAKARLFEGSPAEVIRLRGGEAFAPAGYAGASLVFVALAGDEAARATVIARQAGALVNAVDRPDLCDFTTPAIVDRGSVVGAVMTGGAAPALATELRLALEAQWPTSLGRVADLLDWIKQPARVRLSAPDDRRTFLRALIRGPAGAAALENRMAEAQALALAALDATEPPAARVVLIRAPDAPDLLSLRALRWLSEADRIVADAGIDPALLRLARRDAPLTILANGFEGETAHLRAWLGQAALLVRLCAGDPQPEAITLQAAGLSAELG